MTTSNARREYDRLGSGTRLLLEEKRALRHTMMARRQEVSPEERARLSAAMTARLETLPELVAASASGGTVAGFVALPAKGEVDPAAALAAAHARGAHVALPRVSARAAAPAFSRRRSDRRGALAPGPYGLREPTASAPEVAVESIDVMLLPGLAFDRAGPPAGLRRRLLRRGGGQAARRGPRFPGRPRLRLPAGRPLSRRRGRRRRRLRGHRSPGRALRAGVAIVGRRGALDSHRRCRAGAAGAVRGRAAGRALAALAGAAAER